uniref:Uncharacterized protein n=1 Tax=Branchiostoma floridae TaxID=7739 RepID=C3YSX7_BRAFL|eukprot:XP_002600629.1 hypothetical protein BRAFLDRAFT_95143 [Branchiostoma floridae]
MDRVHLNKFIRGKVSCKTTWSKGVFLGRKQAAKNKVKYRFAVEVARHQEAEHSKDLERFGTRRRVEMERAMERAIEAIPSCYGRLASAIHSSNNGVGLSIVMKRCAAGIPLSKHSPTVRALQQVSNEEGTTIRTRMNVVKKFNAYDETREQGTVIAPNYRQGDRPQVLTGRSPPSTDRAIAPNYRQGDHPKLPTGRSPRTTGRAIAPKYPLLL